MIISFIQRLLIELLCRILKLEIMQPTAILN